MSLSVKFYLESKIRGDKGKLLPIFLYVRRTGEKTIKLHTKRKCSWASWDSNRGRANPRKFSTAIELNGFLSEVEEEVSTVITIIFGKAK